MNRESLFADYQDNHRHPGNKLTHTIGIPLIVFSSLGLLSRVGLGGFLDVGLLLVILVAPFYLWLGRALGVAFVALLVLGWWVSRGVPVPVHWILFVAGWILQGIGHAVYEKRSPAFARNLVHLLVGPMWIFRGLVRRR